VLDQVGGEIHHLAAAVLLALFAAGAVRQSVVNRRPMENRS
ncbi:hypothetical protein, partial [Pseudomonas aeruginosa]